VTTFVSYSDYMVIGIREAKARLSEYIRRANAGEVVTITDRGKVVALLVPPQRASSIDKGLAEGWITPPSKRASLEHASPAVATRPSQLILDEDRSDQ